MTLSILGHDFVYEMECIIRIFLPDAKINIVKYDDFTDDNAIITRVEPIVNHKLLLTVQVRLEDFDEIASREIQPGEDGDIERRLGILLFGLLSEKTEMRPVWGILTGVRPVRLCEQWRGQGLNETEILKRMTQDYLVTEEKARLCLATGKAQEKLISLNTPDTFSLYIGIPFCPTRCLYCSFVSHAIDKAAKLVPDYVRLLCEELRHIAKIAKAAKLRLLTVYVGGGTPTTLTAIQLRQILSTVDEAFDMTDLLEYTVEAGRADTITAEKLETLRSFGVDRISVNPQSMNDDVLKAIGRSHTSKQVEESFYLARLSGFSCINMDLIAGLPTETAESFAKSLDKVLSLTPENVTIHALTVKRSSNLREQEGAFADANPAAAEMQAYAAKKLSDAGYFPYYLYRQKPTVQNLENTGYSRPRFEGVYNIYSMEDTHNILAAGAGGVSKLIRENGDIKRIFNYKYPYEYVNRFDEKLEKFDKHINYL